MTDRSKALVDWYMLRILVPYPLNVCEVGGPNPEAGWCWPLATKIPRVFHRTGKVFPAIEVHQTELQPQNCNWP
jgi:hypothetical protein